MNISDIWWKRVALGCILRPFMPITTSEYQLRLLTIPGVGAFSRRPSNWLEEPRDVAF